MSDTSPEAAEIQASIYRGMTGEQRLRLAFEMSQMARDMALARLRAQHPDWSEWELKRQLLRHAFGSARFLRLCADDWERLSSDAESPPSPRWSVMP